MRDKYFDLISQTFEFPQDEFEVDKGELTFHELPLNSLVEKYGTPLKLVYLPNISRNIDRAKAWFKTAMEQVNYPGTYQYCYCTKSSHFNFVLEEILKNEVHIETSSSFDIRLVKNLVAKGSLSKDAYVVCNGFKPDRYIEGIADLINDGFKNCIPVLDNKVELRKLLELTDQPMDLGIRIAAEESPKFDFYTSRLGIGYRDIVEFYKRHIQEKKGVKLKMLHFFINTGIQDNSYYWNELHKCLEVYAALKKVCPTLDSLNIGGGLPIKRSLSFDFDYQHIISEIINQIQQICNEKGVECPNIFSEFGSFTVGESGMHIYSIIGQKQQNDREKWNMIDGSFINNLPDTWAIGERFIMLPLNRWDDRYERVLLGGLTCDSDDYYNSEPHVNAIYLPNYKEDKPLYVGFFNTGAYQDSLSGFGGIKHCLIPSPQIVLLDRDEEGNLTEEVFAEEQKDKDMLRILGYE
jgi:arginine decarboxylase